MSLDAILIHALAALPPTLLAFAALLKARTVVKQGQVMYQQMLTLEVQVNGRIDALLATTAREAHAAGVQVGLAQASGEA